MDKFDIQKFAEVLHGTSGSDYADQIGDNTQVYGLAGNDSMEATGKKNLILIGGSGNDFIHMNGGSGTLNGGAGSDIFKISYSGANTISAVIEDFAPTTDKLIINYAGSETPKINYSTVGQDIILTDDAGYLNVTLKGCREANDYFDGVANENVWEVFKIVNQERENQGLNQLILSQGLIESSSIRAVEIENTFEHTRPDGTSCFTAVEKSYNPMGENIAAGYSSPENVMTGWMNSDGHRANILKANFTKIGVGYFYKSRNYWVQMFGGALDETETVSTAQLLGANVTVSANGATKSTSTLGNIASLKRTTISGTSGADLLVNGEWYGEKGTQNIVISGGNGNDTISNSGANSILDGGSGDDEIHNGYYFYEGSWTGFLEESYNNINDDENKSSGVTIIGGKGNDSIDNNAANTVYFYETGDGDDTISGYTASDTIKISGSYSTLNSGSDILISVGSGSILLKNASGKTLNIVGETETIPAGISISGATLTASTNFSGDRIDLADYGSAVKILNATALTKATYLVGNSQNNKILGGKGADSLSGDLGNDTLTGNGGNDIFVYSDGDDFITDYSDGDKIRLASAPIASVSVKSSDVIFKISDGSLTVKNGKGKNIIVTDSTGGETVHSFATETETLPAGISIKVPVLTASKKFTGNEINLANYSGVTKVNAAAVTKNISIIGSAENNSLKGSKNSDTISGGLGNDTVSLGAGNDVYIYSGGNDFIQDYKTGEDKIKISSATLTGASLSSSNVILKTSAGNITVKGAKNKKITVIDSDGNETSNIYPLDTMPAGLSYDSAKKVLTVDKKFTGSSIDLADFATSVKTVDASNFTKKIKITGNNRGDSILGGSKADTLIGGSKADTLSGGKGNDTLTGGAGKDVFIYSAGKDVITDYAAGDKIKISSGSISATSYSGNNVVFKIGSGSITVKEGKGKKITITDASNKTSTQTYSGAVSGTSKLFVDDNFIGENNLDAIVEEKISVTEIQPENNFVAQDETLITYSEK